MSLYSTLLRTNWLLTGAAMAIRTPVTVSLIAEWRESTEILDILTSAKDH